MSTTPTTRTHTARRLGTNRRVVLAGLAFVATGLLASCSGVGTSDASQASGAGKDASTTVAPVASPVVAPVDDTTTVAPADPGAGQGTPGQGGGSSQSGGGSGSGGGNQGGGSPHTPSSPAPVINSFHTPENIDCHNGNFQTFSASWSVANADKVTISIDGPGVYKTYPATGSDSLPFNCSSSHTFLLTAYGHNGQKATRTITLQPRNVQTPPSPTDDEDQDPASTVPAPAPTTTMP